MTVYVCLLLAVFMMGFFFLSKLRNRKYFLICSFFLMALVLSLRGETVGEDTKHYIYVFDIIREIPWVTVLTSIKGVVWDPVWGQSVEIGYGILNKIVGTFTSNGQAMIAVVATLTCWLFGRFIYRNLPKHVFIATVVVLCDSLFMGAFNGIRQMLAVAIVVNAYEYVQHKELKKAIVIIVLGIMIHTSAIVIVPFLMLSQVKNKKAGIRYTTIAAVVLPMLIPIITVVISKLIPRYSVYFSINYWNANSLGGTLILWFFEIGIALYIFSKKKISQEEYIGTIGLILYIAAELIGHEIVAVGRLTYYFRFFTIFLFASFCEHLNKKSRYIYYSVFLLLMILEYISFARTPARLYKFFF